ncbi:hypothetical protein ACQ86O_15130 [Serratia sp. L9]|uniref:fimbrial biogenesis chaperone n=1 Tax=Serratia sp. L9 TaxID=3423946 RepID=UPI003D66979A
MLTANNDSGYYASFIKAAVMVGDKEVPFKVDMVAPKSQASWKLEKGTISPAGAKKVSFTLVNDYGAHSRAQATLN